MGTLKIILGYSNMAAAAKSGDSGLFRGTEKPPGGAHGVDRVLRIAAVAAVACNVIGGMDAFPPEFYRLAKPSGLGAVASDADDLIPDGNICCRDRLDYAGNKECKADAGYQVIHRLSLKFHE
jgi:hypothetical protein